EPVTWNTNVEKVSDTTYQLIIEATIEEGWHLYSQVKPEGEITPIPTEFQFKNDDNAFELIGSTQESEPVTKYDKVFEIDLSFFDGTAKFTQKIKLLDPDVTSVFATVAYQACDDQKCIYRDEALGFSLDGNAVEFQQETVDEASLKLAEKLEIPIKNPESIVSDINEREENSGLLNIFILGFLGGLIALLTPCVFPMIPLTVSFFTKQTKDRKKGITNAVLYGVFIVVIYILLSLPFHFLDAVNPEILNTISTNIWLNIFFFAIFVFFAFSFFGYYELTLPSSWGNRMDAASNIGGFIGIFFMALTLAIVSFSCTGPILGSLLAGSLTADGGAIQLTTGMAGFGTALALPFALFALFPNWLNSLPKSGGWMTTTKVVLGFLELALAFKFLSNADLVAHWGILKREVFIGIWIVIFVLLALYMFGLIRFPHDGPKKKLKFPRITFGILVVAFIVYLISGLQKTETVNLNLLSGFPPPFFYSVYEQESDCPLGLNCFKDFEEGVAYAKANNKPILIDFTGWACVNCRKMEENVWSKDNIFALLKEHYILISLYVDDRKTLPEDQQFKYQRKNGTVKTIETIGDKWATFQAINFKTASQPYYIIMDPDYELLNTPQQYTSADTYYQWLKDGLAMFNQK
ncbi:MAG: cytochrome c biogenesis protein CcdA, partial [Bacteroidota bacterium]